MYMIQSPHVYSTHVDCVCNWGHWPGSVRGCCGAHPLKPSVKLKDALHLVIHTS